jgi:hypothetical protein
MFGGKSHFSSPRQTPAPYLKGNRLAVFWQAKKQLNYLK